jgi:ABC-type transport system involved in multi-copper enzyme maturation permease subunit
MNAIATRPATPRSLRAVVAYTLRSALPGRRWLGALIPAATAILFGLIATTVNDTRDFGFVGVAADSLYVIVLPITALVIGDAVLGAEVRSGTFAFTWMSPVPTWQITVGRWLGGTIAAASTIAVAFGLSAVVAGAPELAGAAATAGAFGAAAYVAVFIAIGCITKRAAVWSIAFVILVEQLIGGALSGVAQLSSLWESRAAFIGLSDIRPDLEREGIPHGTDALVRLVLITAVALVLANWRLRTLKLTGSSD